MHPSCLRNWDRDSCQEAASEAPIGWGPYPCCLLFIIIFTIVFLGPCVLYFLPPCHPTFYPFSLSASPFLLRFLHSTWLQALLWSLFLVWMIVSGLVVYIHVLLMCLWDIAYPGRFISQYYSWKHVTLGPLFCSVSQGLWVEIFLKGGHGEACRAMLPRLLPQVSLPLTFYFQHIYMASFLRTVLTFRK